MLLAAAGVARGVGWRVPRRPPSVLSYRRLIQRHAPDVWAHPDPVVRAARYWVSWNEATERAAVLPGLVYRRYRLEDLDGDLLAELMALVGHDFEVTRCKAAVAAVPDDTNSYGPNQAVDWSRVPRQDRLRVEALADRYGYEL